MSIHSYGQAMARCGNSGHFPMKSMVIFPIVMWQVLPEGISDIYIYIDIDIYI